MLYVLLFLAGLAGGIYGGNVGSGALVSLPILIMSGLPTPVAIATQRLAGLMGEVSSSLRFHQAKEVMFKKALLLSVFAAAGSFLGSHITTNVPERVLDILMIVSLLTAFFAVTFSKQITSADGPGKIPWKWICPATFVLGIYGGFLGVGFGTFIMVLLNLAGFSLTKSAAMGRVIGVCMTLPSVLVFAHAGILNYAYGISVGAGFAVGGWIGVGYALKKGDAYVRVLLLFVILATIVKLAMGF